MRPSSKTLPLLTVGILLALAAEIQAQDTSGAPEGDTRQVVVVSEKSALGAAALEWFIPTVGYAYAGSWSRGIPSGLVRVGGLVLMASQQLVLFGEPPPCRDRCVVGAAVFAAATIWAMVDAGRTAGRENEKRRAAASGVALVPTFGDAGPGLGLRIPVGW